MRKQGHLLTIGDTVTCEGAKLPNGLPGEPTRKTVIAVKEISTGAILVTWRRHSDGATIQGISSQIMSYDVLDCEKKEGDMDTLERTLAIEFNTAQPFMYWINPGFMRLIEAGWAWRRISMHGYWIVGFTEMGHAAAEMCGLYDDIRRNWQQWED